MLKQTDVVIDVLEHMFPCAQFAFQFDWSSGHHMYSPDALIPRHMNRTPGGRQPLMRPTVIQRAEDAPLLGVGTTQHLIFRERVVVIATGQPAPVGKAKGAEQVLRERGLYVPGMSLNGGKDKMKRSRWSLGWRSALISNRQSLCCRRWSRTAVTCVCVFGAKYHCECAPIALLWGRGKHDLRARCDFSLDGLRRNNLQAFLDVPLLSIRKFFRKSRDYMRAYREGHMTLSAEKRVSEYKSHRRPAPSELLNH